MINGKDYLLRLLAFGAYIIAFYFSWISLGISEAPEMLALVWGVASLIYWGLVNEFEKRDHRWKEEAARTQ